MNAYNSYCGHQTTKVTPKLKALFETLPKELENYGYLDQLISNRLDKTPIQSKDEAYLIIYPQLLMLSGIFEVYCLDTSVEDLPSPLVSAAIAKLSECDNFVNKLLSGLSIQ